MSIRKWIGGTIRPDRLETDSVVTEKLDSRNGYESLGGARSFDTWYQNTEGADLNVAVMVDADTDSTTWNISLNVNDSQSGLIVARSRGTFNANERVTLTATVPAGYYYQLTFIGGDSEDTSINRWVEQS